MSAKKILRPLNLANTSTQHMAVRQFTLPQEYGIITAL